MSHSDTIVSSTASEKISVEEIRRSKSLPGEHAADFDYHAIHIDDFYIDTFPCVFRAPKSLKQTKPEAYTPQKLGLGPFHHLRPDLYATQREKLGDVIKFLDADENWLQKIEQVKQHVEGRQYLIRASYDEYLNLDRSTLARIVGVDAIYLIKHFDQGSSSFAAAANDGNPGMKKQLAADILMLENQIPGEFLVEIWRILRCGSDSVLSGKVFSFCKHESPLEFPEKPIDIVHLMRQGGHLLSVMYNLILGKTETQTGARQRKSEQVRREAEIAEAIHIPGAAEIAKTFGGKTNETSDPTGGAAMPHHVGSTTHQPDWSGLSAAMEGVPGGAVFQQGLSVMEKLPWARMLDKLEKVDPDREENSLVEEAHIPSVSLLSRNAKITFAPTNKGIRGVRFLPDERKLYLPTITLNSNSEVVLRNLLAYEAAVAKPGSTLELAEYVDLMCAIVDTCTDVNILISNGIIASKDLKPAEIARIFNEICKSTGQDEDEDDDKHKNENKNEKQEEDKANIRKAIKELKALYGKTSRVKRRRCITKCFEKSWKHFAGASSVMIMMLLGLQVYCMFYDCNKHWSVKNMYNPLQIF